MTRFEKELSGALGAYWKKSAEKELEKVREELEQGWRLACLQRPAGPVRRGDRGLRGHRCDRAAAGNALRGLERRGRIHAFGSLLGKDRLLPGLTGGERRRACEGAQRPLLQGSHQIKVTWTTSSGSLVLNGTCTAATTVNIVLVKT